MNRVEKIRKLLNINNLDGFLITNKQNRYYISGFSGSFGSVLITKEENILITDFRYKQQGMDQCKGFKIKIIDSNNTVYDIINSFKLRRLGIEDKDISVNSYFNYINNLCDIEIVPFSGKIEELRSIKDDLELENIRRAASIADESLQELLNYIKLGMTELEIGSYLEYLMRKKGASGISVNTICASGERGALPHGRASEKVVKKNEFLTIDFGCIYNGYCSDMTRTICLGKADTKQKEIYNIVLKAQEEVLKYIKAGITGAEVDKIARDIITEAGYGEYFGHGLGHGVGLEVHELPRLANTNEYDTKIVFEKNMVVTDEPGIYIPGFGGVRIEDLIVVKENECEILSKTTKSLIEMDL